MIARPVLAFTALFFTAGAIVLIFFTLLPGAVNSTSALNNIYFLSADTSTVPGAPKVSQWTLWNVCDGSVDGVNAKCGPVKPAFPFDPPRNFATEKDLPQTFVGFMFAFILIGLVFAVLSLFVGLGAMCFRLGGALSGFVAMIALFWQVTASALMTACFVTGRDAFRKNNQASDVGSKAFGFMWAATTSLFIASMLYFAVVTTGKKEPHSSRGGLFGRKKSVRDRGSFIDHERVIKEDDTTSFERSR